MDSYHHYRHWGYLTALVTPSVAPLHGIHPPSFPAEHPLSPDTRPLVSVSLSRKRSASAVLTFITHITWFVSQKVMDGKVSLDNADPSGYNDPSSVDFSEDYEIRRGR